MIDWDSAVLGPLMAVVGEPVHFMPATTKPFDGAGTFHEAYAEVDPVSGMGVTTACPMLGVQLSQFPSPPLQGDRLRVERTSETFKIREVRPDGVGWAKLMLNLDSQWPTHR